MRATQSLLRTARPFFQQSSATRSPFITAQFQNAFSRSTARAGRRFQTTDAAAAPALKKSWLQRSWDSPIGLKTVHFWAPVMKWCLVLAGVADFARPAEALSVTQNVALTATGAIWTRWCLIIKPRNVLLASVNFLLGCVGIVQVSRIVMYRMSDEGKAAMKAAALKEKVIDSAQDVKEGVQAAISS